VDVEPAALRRARLVVAYDGRGFHGFAESAGGVRTVAGDLRQALATVAGSPVELVGAGRTDAGVHAWGQVVSVDLPAQLDLADVARRVTRMCAPELVVRAAAWTDDGFSARFSASWRHYRYDVLAGAVPVPALAAHAWHVPHDLDLWAMQLACDPIIGEHDFAAFCRRPKVAAGQDPPSLRRRVLLARWTRLATEYGDVLRFEIRANAFCHQMVRSLVGTMVDVGRGRIQAGEVRGILLRGDRAGAGAVAPPHGLTLWEVGYP